MKSRVLTTTLLVSVLLGLAAGLSVLAAAPPFPVNWQGQKALMPTAVWWAPVVGYQGKIYVFAGSYRDSSGAQLMTNVLQIYDTATDTWSMGPNVPTARYLATAVEVGGKIYVMGGRTIDADGNGGPVNVNEVYTPATNTWTTAKSMPAAVRGHGAAAYNGKIYVFGGNTTSYQKTVSIYDPSTDSWSSGANMPSALAYGAVAAAGSKIYWVGGEYRAATKASDLYGKAIPFDPTANTWGTPISMLLPVDQTNAVAEPTSGKIYVFGGEKWDTTAGFLTPTEVCQALDPVAGAFSQINFLPSPVARSSVMPAADGGLLYVLGGDRSSYFASESLRLVEVYDPVSDTYYQGNPPVPDLGVFGAVAGEVNGKIYAADGAAQQAVPGTVSIYDVAGKSWTVGQGVDPTPKYYSVGGVYNGKIVVSGGVNGTQTPVGDTALYDPATDSWTILAPDTTARFGAAGCVLNNVLYVFGGDTNWSSSNLVTDVHALDLASNTWSTKHALPTPMASMVALPCNNKIYLFGGSVGNANAASDFNTQNLVYDPASDSFSTTVAPMPMPSMFAAGAVFGQYLLVHGGYYWQTWGTQSAYGIVKDIQIYDTASNSWTTAEGVFNRLSANMVVAGNALYVFNGLDPSYTADRLLVAQLSTGPAPLAATASADKTTGAPPLSVNFTGGATGGTAPYTYDWDFGDGSAHASTQNASHTYATANTYTAKLTVHDAASGTASKSLTITVSAGALAATASADKVTGSVPFTVQFTGTASGGTGPYTYAWVFGDGSADSTEQNPSHEYTTAGAFQVVFRVTDSTSATATDTHLTILATALPPPAVSSMVKMGNPFRIVVNGSNLRSGIKVYINGTQWTNVVWKSTSKIVLKGGSALKAVVPKNTSAHFKFENVDGGEFEMDWQWP